MRLHVPIHVQVRRERNDAGILGESAGDDDRPNEQWRWRAKVRHRKMLGWQPQTEVARAEENQDNARSADLPPGFPQHQNSEQQNREDESAFLTERAEEKENGGGNMEEPAVSADDRCGPNAAIEPEKSKCGRERISPAGNISNRRREGRMNRPDQRGDEREPAPFSFLDVPPTQQFVREKKEGDRGVEVRSEEHTS